MTDKILNTQKAMMDIITPMDHDIMMKYLNVMCERYKFISLTYIGESILGRGIPMISLGEGKKKVIYIGAHSGTDWMGSAALIRFINEYCEVKCNSGRIYNYSIEYLFATRQICVIPMLNPDGVDICINGVAEDNILRERILSMQHKKDFSDWKANARGVDLQHNYSMGFIDRRTASEEKEIFSGSPFGYGGDFPESEPEVGSLCSYIRFSGAFKAGLCLHGAGDKIFYRTKEKALPRGRSIAQALSRMNGCSLQNNDNNCFGGFIDFCINEINIPCFEIPCGSTNKKYPYSYFDIYSRQREVLFTLPALI